MMSSSKILPVLIACLALVSAHADGIDAGHFALELDGGRTIRRAELSATPAAAGQGERFVSEAPLIAVNVTQRESPAGYRRTFLEVVNTGASDLPLKRIVVLDAPAPAGAHVAGECAGSPVVAGPVFFGVEHPFAENTVAGGRVRCALPIMLPLRPGEKAVASFVCGRAPEPSQLRRTFAAYLDRERPRAYAPFLLHNTWYNLGYSNPFSEQAELQLIDTLGREFVGQRGAKIDG